jgi:RNA polymerase sigma-70 factor (ECF subfamily)
MASSNTAALAQPARPMEIGTLARQAADLDIAAFADLYRLYAPQVLRYVSSRVNGTEEAEDITNTVFEKAFGAIGRYEPSPAQFSTWLYTIAQNTVIDHYRKRRLPQVEDADARLFAITDPNDGPEAMLIADERRRLLYQAVMSLTSEQRQVVGLRFFFNLSTQDVACLMGKTEGAVKALQFRALERLRRGLTPDLARS